MTLTGCFFQADEVEVSDALIDAQDQAEFEKNKAQFGAKITSVEIVGNQIKVNGSNLAKVKNARLKGPGGFNQVLPIESKTDTVLIADIQRNLKLISTAAFRLILNDAFGASTFQIAFTVSDGAITNAKIVDNTIDGKKLADMGASEGDVLSWNNITMKWEPRALSGQTFRGTWDAQNNVPALADNGANTIPTTGDYYIVTNAGGGNVTIDGENAWADGDWIIFDGNDWLLNPIATPAVSTFNGATGAITFDYPDLDFSTSTINDFTDVDTQTFAPTNGQVLKWNGSEWEPADDNDAGGADSVQSSTIIDGSITNDDISGTAAIDQSKVNNLTSDLNLKFDKAGGALSGALNMSNNNIQNVNDINVGGSATITGNTSVTGNAIITGDLTVSGDLNWANSLNSATFTNNADNNNKGNNLVLRRVRQDANTPGGADFGSTIAFEAEGFTDGSSARQSSIFSGWEVTQTDNTTARDSYMTFSTSEDGSETEAMRINSAGYIGIGTNDPTQMLDVQGQDEDVKLSITNHNSTGAQNPGLMLFNYDGAQTGGYPSIQGNNAQGSSTVTTDTLDADRLFELVGGGYNGATGVNGFNKAASISFEAGDDFSATSTPGEIHFQTTEANDTNNPQTRMVIKDAGQVAIGSASPNTAYALTVDGSTRTVLLRTDDSVNTVKISNNDSGSNLFEGMDITANSSNAGSVSTYGMPLLLSTSSATGVGATERMRITADGDIGMGTNAPSSFVEVKGNLSSAIAGTVSVNSGTPTVVGTGTSFTTDLVVGQKIKIDGNVYEIQTIFNNSQLQITTNSFTTNGSATVFEESGDSIFKVSDGAGNNLFEVTPSGVTFDADVTSNDVSNSGAVNIEADSDNSGGESISFINNGAPRMEIKGTGDIEVGAVDLGEDGNGATFSVAGTAEPAIFAMGEDSNNKATMVYDNADDSLTFETSNAGTPYANTLVLRDGRVGINNNSLNARLEVTGGDQTSILSTVADNTDFPLQLQNLTYSDTLDFLISNTGDVTLDIPDDGANPGQFVLRTDETARLTIADDGTTTIAGNVGVGAAPSYPLDVQLSSGGSPTAAVLRISQTSTTGAGNSSNALILFEGDNGIDSRDYVMGTGSTLYGGPTNFGIYDITGTTSRFIIEPGGDVGVGVTDALAGFHVGNGVLRVDGQAGTGYAGGGQILLENNSGDVTTAIGTDTDGVFVRTKGNTSNEAFKLLFGSATLGIEVNGDAGGGIPNIQPVTGTTSMSINELNTLDGAANIPLTIVSDDAAAGSDGIVLNRTNRTTAGNNAIATFKYDGTELARMTTEGRFGVGSNNPNAIIEAKSVAPDIAITDSNSTLSSNAYTSVLEFRDSANAQVGQLGFPSGSNNNLVLRNFTTAGDLDFQVNGGNIKMLDNGRVGIGSTTPSVRTQIVSGALCVGSEADCDGSTDSEGTIYAQTVCDETGGNCIDLTNSFASDINTLSDGKTNTSSVFLGSTAGANDDDSANKNTGIGVAALNAATSGEENTALGNSAGTAITTAINNTAVGASALPAATTGGDNTAIGRQSLLLIAGGADNTALGHQAGATAQATSAQSVFLGSESGPNPAAAVTGAVALGYQAQTDANNAIAIGSAAEVTGANGVAIGQGATATSNQVVLGNSSITETILQGDIGIGGSSSAALTITDTSTAGSGSGLKFINNGSATFENYFTDGTATADFNFDYTATGNVDIKIQNDGDLIFAESTSGKVGIGTSAPDTLLHVENTGGNASARIESSAGIQVDVEADGSQGTLGTASNHPLRLITNNTEHVTIATDGKVGIGATTPTSLLQVGDAPTGTTTLFDYMLTVGGKNLDDGTTNTHGSFGQIKLNSNNDEYTQARSYVITNALDASKFAIMRSTNNATTPSISTTVAEGDTISNGVADFVIDNTGQVGIGTIDPSEKLEVNGNLKFTASSGFGITFEDGTTLLSANGATSSTVTNTDSDTTIVADSNNDASGSILFQVGPTTYATINNSGQFQVGTTSNSSSITAYDSTINATMDATNKNRVGVTSTNDTSSAIQMETRASDDGGTMFGSSLNNMSYLTTSGASSTGLLVGTQTADPLIFGTNNAEVARFDANGKLGIGTSSPETNLHVSYASTADGDNNDTLVLEEEAGFGIGVGPGISFKGEYDSSNNVISFGGVKGVKENGTDANTEGALVFTTNSGSSTISEKGRFDSDGNFGVGTSSPGTVDSTQFPATGATLFNIHDGNAESAIIVSTDKAASDGTSDTSIKFSANSEDLGYKIKADVQMEIDGTTANRKGGALVFRTLADNTSGAPTERVRIDQTGKVAVGMGGSDASNMLEVREGTGSAQARFSYDASNYVEFQTQSNGNFTINPNGTPQLLVETGGFIGVGVSDALYDLHVQTAVSGAGTIFAVSADDGGDVLRVGKNGTDDALISILDTSGNTDIQFNPAGDSYINGSNEFGIGITNPTYKLDVETTASNDVIAFQGNGSEKWTLNATSTGMSFQNKDTVSTPMEFLNNGNVGINESTPSKKLQVTDTSEPLLLVANSDTDSNESTLVLRRSRSSASAPGSTSAGDFMNSISFELETFTNDTFVEANQIVSKWRANQTNNTTDRDSQMIFKTMLNNTISQAMIIDEDGQVGIGTMADPAYKLDVDGDVNISSGSSYLTNGADYAEYFLSEGELQPGDIVGINPNTGIVRYYQTGDVLLGVVSSAPGLIGNTGIKDLESEKVALMGQVPYNPDQVIVEGRSVKTLDGKNLGTLLASGDIYLNISSADDRQDREIASLKDEVEDLKSENEMLKSYLCTKDPDAPFCQ